MSIDSKEAEESVCGGILTRPQTLDEVGALRAEDFYYPAPRAIFEAAVELRRESRPIDALTVAEMMRGLGTFDRLNALHGSEYLVDLQARVVTLENFAYHAKLVRQKAKARRVAGVAYEVWKAAQGVDVDVEDYLGSSAKAFNALQFDDEEIQVHTIKALIREFTTQLETRVSRGTGLAGIPIGYHKFDELVAGLAPGDLVIIAARPSMGKTAFAMNILANCAAVGVPGLCFSLEMHRLALVERLVAARGRIDSQKLRRGTVKGMDWSRVTSAADELVKMPVEICDVSGLDVLQIGAKARAWIGRARKAHEQAKRSAPFEGLIVIDYLQLIVETMSRRKREQNRTEAVAEISRSLKALAKELGVPVIALSQLNRSLEARSDKRPMLSDLRESGAIEQDADLVAFIYRDEVYSKDECKEEDRGVAEIIIGKQRNGDTGTVRLAFLAQYQRFENLAERAEPNRSQTHWGDR